MAKPWRASAAADVILKFANSTALSDADAMMPQMKLSDFTEVQLVARVSRAGQPTHGEWIGQGQPLASSTQDVQRLVIDSPDGTPP